MYLLNLSLLQFVAVFASISAFAVALYLLDRSRRKQVVSTLRFWVAAEQPAVAARRRHINQPWSLILHLLSMALLLLAIAPVASWNTGARRPRSRDRPRYFVLDGSPFRKPDTHGPRPASAPGSISARCPRATGCMLVRAEASPLPPLRSSPTTASSRRPSRHRSPGPPH